MALSSIHPDDSVYLSHGLDMDDSMVRISTCNSIQLFPSLILLIKPLRYHDWRSIRVQISTFSAINFARSYIERDYLWTGRMASIFYKVLTIYIFQIHSVFSLKLLQWANGQNRARVISEYLFACWLTKELDIMYLANQTGSKLPIKLTFP